MGVRQIFLHAQNPIAELTNRGWVYDIAETTLDQVRLGTTSYATTTPMFLLNIAADSGLAAMPISFSLGQAGTVAGGPISVLMEKDNAARFGSGGNATGSMKSLTMASGLPTGASALTLPTATDAAGMRMWGVIVGQDVSPAEGVSNELIWTWNGAPDYLVTSATLGASWLVHAFAATTAPGLFWTAKVAIFPLAEL